LISAVADGVVIAGTTGNVDNTGTIQGGNSGVWLEAGGTVANSGSIAGTGTSSYGVRLTAGGSVTNGSPGVLDASITGAEGVGIAGVAGTVTNYGTIAATSHGGYFGAGGAITNRNLISGGTDVDFVTGSAGTIANSGTILGTTGGLEQYAELFCDNDIDGEILRGMTADDLKELGISSFGHRRRLVAAITALGAAAPDAAVTAASPEASAPAEAERRQLTVMFCDLVGSTALSTRHDPEDLRELIGDYHRAVADTVAHFDGFVAKYMGDGVLVYFGYPQAHEDDAERAVRAGLAVAKAVGKLPAREDLSVRLGIATGLAVVGDLIGEGAAQEYGVVGETPNLAARLQALAAPNTLVIAEATRRQIGGLFDLADLGPQALAGFAEPQPACLCRLVLVAARLSGPILTA
jgi:class 3 adenylate cyclase